MVPNWASLSPPIWWSHLVEKELNENGATKKTLANANETFVNELES